MTDRAKHLGPCASEGHEDAASRVVVVVWWCVGGARLFGAACVIALWVCLPRLIIGPDELGVAIADAHLRR